MLTFATKLRPTKEALEAAEQAGFPAVELWTNAKVLLQRKEITDLARNFSFDYVIHFPNRRELTPDHLRNATLLCEKLKCQAMVIHQPMYQRYGDELLAIKPSLRLGVENHELSTSQFRDWAKRNRWLTLDVEHLWKFTLNDGPLPVLLDALKEFLERFGEKLVHVHLPGYLPHYGEHRPMYCSREMVMSVLSILADVGYEGFVVGEVNPEYQNVYDLRMDVLLAQRWQQIREKSVSGIIAAPANEALANQELARGDGTRVA